MKRKLIEGAIFYKLTANHAGHKWETVDVSPADCRNAMRESMERFNGAPSNDIERALSIGNITSFVIGQTIRI